MKDFFVVVCCFVLFSGDILEFYFSFCIIVQDCQGLSESHGFMYSWDCILVAPVNSSLCYNKLREDKVSRLLLKGRGYGSTRIKGGDAASGA